MAAAAAHSLRSRIEQLLRVDPGAKPRVYREIFESAEIASLNYWLELVLSAGIATLGLVLNSPAVVIGAMLISPLMGPIMAAGLALAAADLYLGIKSLVNLAASIAGAVLFSAGLVWLLPFQTPTAEILSRTQPNLLDLGVALFSGLAGSILLCRGGGAGGVTALPGVAIAVALMPPLCTAGFGVGSGFNRTIISGAALLFLTNLAAIVASALLVFFAVRMDAPEVRVERASGGRIDESLRRTALLPSGIAKLRYRILMPVAMLAVLFVPLRQSLLQVRDETVARGAIRDAVRRLAPPWGVVAQSIQLASDRIQVRLVVTDAVEPARVEEAKRLILRRTGKDVELSVRKVAGEEELALLRERLRTPAAPPVQDLASVKAEMMARLEGPLKEIWPSDRAQLLEYELGFTAADTVVRIRYQAADAMEAAAEEILTRAFRARLGTDRLRLVLERQAPPPPQSPGKKASPKKGARR